MGRTVSYASGYAPDDDEFDPLTDDFISRERKYLHFDRALNDHRRGEVRATSAVIMSNAFWPLLAFSKIERRVKRDKLGVVTFTDKTREIKFGSHYDSAILEHYAVRLASAYGGFLDGKPIAASVLAYRRGLGSNIQHAKLLFDELRSRDDSIAIAVDVSGFFDNIRHSVMLDNLKTVLNVERLSESDFKIFSRMTHFDWVDVERLEERLDGKRRFKGRLCDAYQFRKYVREKGSSIVETNTKFFGIPQGTPLSGLYANISLIDFDTKLEKYFSVLVGVVRRYSDDIAVIVPSAVHPNTAIAFIRDQLKEIGLSISEHKTDISRFAKDLTTGLIVADKPFQYLGFTFDRNKTLIRQSSLNRYYSKMKSGIHAKIIAAKRNNVLPSAIYMRELFRKYTHFGKHRNFPRYAYRAAREMDAPEIKRQVANHFDVFKAMVKTSIDTIY